LVAEAPRVAPVVHSRDWTEKQTPLPDVSSLPAAARKRLADHYAGLGQMEHASIAAFARFNLQLLAVGAPAALVDACNSAIIDETAHARRCFALASHYAGSPLGPAALDVGQSLDATTLEGIARLVIIEGCLGETGAALEAFEIAATASDAAIRQVFSQIAVDEQRHAELAFSFLRWVLGGCDERLRAELERVAALHMGDYERAALSSTTNGEAGASLAAHGLLPAETRRRIRLQATRSIVRPVLSALFDGSAVV
jgi:hypothetical protein